MALRTVKLYPDPVLRKKAQEVSEIDDGIRAVVEDMFETMEQEGGVGLAAPQIGITNRIIVISIHERGFERLALINPVIMESSPERAASEEGCLSFPGIEAEVSRPERVMVQVTTKNGRVVEITATGLLARVLQHEIDHLNGVLFIDRLTEKGQKRIEDELDLLKRNYTAMAR
jgi:peptide deformylase